jgi:hypothetical protein
MGHLFSPPNVSLYRGMIKETYYPIYRMDNQEKQAFIVKYEVQIPDEVSLE